MTLQRRKSLKRTRKRKPKTATDKAVCDRLCRRLVIHRAQETNNGLCERCGIHQGEHWAHIIPRRFSAVRCVEDNAGWICPHCHRIIDTWPEDKAEFAYELIGRVRYEELRSHAEKGPPTSYTLWWRQERERLTRRCEELGISTKSRDVS